MKFLENGAWTEMKVAVLSDTHGLLRSEVKEIIRGCDVILHGGDVHSQKIVDEMKEVKRKDAPLYIVRGNNDREWAKNLPYNLELELGGINFYMVHDKKELPNDLSRYQAVIFGHSHKYYEAIREGRLYLNPGSCGRRRFHLPLTMAVLHIQDGKCSVERIDISHEGGKDRQAVPEENLLENIQDIMKRMDKGHTVAKMSRELRLEQQFVEDVCRIRVTHPGVTANGIMDKIEVNQQNGTSANRKC